MIGLDNSGKTLLFNRLLAITTNNEIELDPLLVTPTMGFSSEVVKYKNLSFVLIEYGGDERIRNLWKYSFTHCYLLIYVVDSSDVSRLKESAITFDNVLSNEDLNECDLILIYANKQDVEGALNAEEITAVLNLNNIKQHWHLQLCSALNNEGLREGLEWIHITYRNIEKQRGLNKIC